jgi:hypothetical protein
MPPPEVPRTLRSMVAGVGREWVGFGLDEYVEIEAVNGLPS